MPKKLTVKQWRKVNGYSVEKVASIIGVHFNTYMNWEKKPDHIPVGKALEIAKLYGVDINDILFTT